MANQEKEHGPHPFALLREWKLAIKKTLQAHAKTELEYYKLAEFMDCLLLFSPTLDAGKVSFKATFAQIQELHNDVTRKSIYNRADRLKEMEIILSWEQPEAKKKGEFNPTVWTVGKISGGKKDGGENGEGKKDGVPEGTKDRVPRVKDGKLQDFTREDFTRSGHSSGHTGHSSGQKITDTVRQKTADTAKQKTVEQLRRQAYLEAYGEIDQTTIEADRERYRIQMLSDPKLLHDKGCAAYPCRMDVWCDCGLEDLLVDQFFDEYGDQNPWELPCPQCGSKCAGSCQPVPPESDKPEKTLLFGREG